VPNDTTPATVVILARVDATTTDEGFAALAASVRRCGAAVTWVADGETVKRLSRETSDQGWALALDGAATESRQRLRQHLLVLRRAAVDGVVVADGGTIAQRDLLVAEGIHTAVVDRFDEVTRGSRRPSPEGWACRSVVWGLWEVESTPTRGGSRLGRWIPWIGGPAAGSLTVVTVPGEGAGIQTTADRVTRVIAAHRGGRHPKRFARLGDLPGLLGSGGQPNGGSVLRAA
jgi:hypothetical protein